MTTYSGWTKIQSIGYWPVKRKPVWQLQKLETCIILPPEIHSPSVIYALSVYTCSGSVLRLTDRTYFDAYPRASSRNQSRVYLRQQSPLLYRTTFPMHTSEPISTFHQAPWLSSILQNEKCVRLDACL